MATHKSAEKCIRQIARRTEVNGNRIGRIRTFIKKVEAKIDSANQAEARIALVEAEREIMRGVTKGVLHLNTAARKVSRLSKRIKALA